MHAKVRDWEVLFLFFLFLLFLFRDECYFPRSGQCLFGEGVYFSMESSTTIVILLGKIHSLQCFFPPAVSCPTTPVDEQFVSPASLDQLLREVKRWGLLPSWLMRGRLCQLR